MVETEQQPGLECIVQAGEKEGTGVSLVTVIRENGGQLEERALKISGIVPYNDSDALAFYSAAQDVTILPVSDGRWLITTKEAGKPKSGIEIFPAKEQAYSAVRNELEGQVWDVIVRMRGDANVLADTDVYGNLGARYNDVSAKFLISLNLINEKSGIDDQLVAWLLLRLRKRVRKEIEQVSANNTYVLKLAADNLSKIIRGGENWLYDAQTGMVSLCKPLIGADIEKAPYIRNILQYIDNLLNIDAGSLGRTFEPHDNLLEDAKSKGYFELSKALYDADMKRASSGFNGATILLGKICSEAAKAVTDRGAKKTHCTDEEYLLMRQFCRAASRYLNKVFHHIYS